MLFYVFMNPDIILTAQQGGSFGLQSLISILRGFVDNCCVVEFEDSRVQEAIKEHVNGLTELDERKRIKSLLSMLKKRNRFIYCLVPDDTGNKDDNTCVCEQATESLVDLILTNNLETLSEIPKGTEATTLTNYQNTNFEVNRSRIASNGRAFADGELEQIEFLEKCFRKALKYATKIEIIDRLFGERFGDNFEYTIKTLLGWLEGVLSEPRTCKFCIHCGKPEGYMDNHIKNQLAQFKRGRLVNMPIEICFYVFSGPNQCLPHQRFILTDQITLSIDRGMDFLNRHTRKNRDLSIDYKSIEEVNRVLCSYSAGMIKPIII